VYFDRLVLRLNTTKSPLPSTDRLRGREHL
jgi:hypothetical protein